jgi:sarcosine oxidase subunit gamma
MIPVERASMAEAAVRHTPSVSATPWMRPLPPATRFILHGDSRVRAAAAVVWQAPFSEEACRALVQGSRATLWLGPDEYLLLDAAWEFEGEAAVAAAVLERAIGDLPHALVDISHRQTAIEIFGPHAAAILNGACPLDLDRGEFPVGMCTRTVLAKADIVLWRTKPDAFHVEVWRSFGDYACDLLREIARDYFRSVLS